MTRRDDPVAAFLRARGCPAFVIEGGVERLLVQWERLAASLSARWEFGLDDWLNELDGRRLLAELRVATPAAFAGRVGARLEAADALFGTRTREVGVCLWGAKAAVELGITAKEQGWYFRVPKESATDLLAEVGPVR